VSPGKQTSFYQSFRCKEGSCVTDPLELIGEEPFLIRIEDNDYSVVMRTPGDEVFHAAGFCLGEGIIDDLDDIRTIGYDRQMDANVVDVWLTPERRKKIPHLLKRKSYISQTSCGICGKKMIEDLNQMLTPAADGFEVDLGAAIGCMNKLSKNQKYYQRTRGSHAALLFDHRLNAIAFAEDVGRHNGLDKAIGKTVVNKTICTASLLVLSSRISYELVQKAARARIPIIISNSRPTALAVQMGQSLNMTLAFPGKESELIIACGRHRIKTD
jgi:FdhD protein